MHTSMAVRSDRPGSQSVSCYRYLKPTAWLIILPLIFSSKYISSLSHLSNKPESSFKQQFLSEMFVTQHHYIFLLYEVYRLIHETCYDKVKLM